jgi:hypothetical protein
MSVKIYPADFTLTEWLRLRAGWCSPKLDAVYWLRAQITPLGPNLAALSNPPQGSAERERYIQGIEDSALQDSIQKSYLGYIQPGM